MDIFEKGNRKKSVAIGVGVAAAGAALAFLSTRIRTSRSNEWLVRTGLFVPDLQVRKVFVCWPYQFVRPVKLEAHTFRFTVSSMTEEKLSVEVPMTWSVAVENTEAAVTAFARRVEEGGDITKVRLRRPSGIVSPPTVFAPLPSLLNSGLTMWFYRPCAANHEPSPPTWALNSSFKREVPLPCRSRPTSPRSLQNSALSY